ncbi:MAG: hypothetical protein V1799_02970 [bacterium]
MPKAKRVTYFKAKIEDKPGALLALVKDLMEKKQSLVGLRGFSQAGEGGVLVVPKNPDKLRNIWKASGTLAEEGTVFFFSGKDKTGALVASLDAIAKAGVNIAAIEAVAVGGRFGTFLWVAQADIDKTAQVLRAK